jgi:hypothetical protein
VYATFGSQAYFIDLKNANSAYWHANGSGDKTTAETMVWTTSGSPLYGGATGTLGQFNVWVPVPEPTSMALLGLGAAVVGLRRKFRKS